MLNLYTETAFQVQPYSSTKRLDVSIPRANGSYDRSKHSKKPVRTDQLAKDDKTYTSEYLAPASSIFFRHSHSYPRSFLWRIVGNDHLLEIFNTDISRPEHDAEADLVLAFEFQDQISPRGVSICEVDKSDEFSIFVLTRANEVFELRLQTIFFQDATAIPQDTTAWCSAVRASALSIDQAFHIHATNPHDVFVAFASGKIQHWKRSTTQQDQWSCVTYDDKTWGSSLLSIVSRKTFPDYDFDGMRLAYNTSHAMTRRGHYLFTICLNHTLRIWHLESGKLVDSRDLLDTTRDLKDPSDRIRLSPAEPGYIAFLDGGWNKNGHILMTYSPLDGGQVKYWNVKGTYSDELDLFSIEDMAPRQNLRLPDPDPDATNHWSLAGLRTIWEKHTKCWRVWILWRNNNYHKAYALAFEFEKLQTAWETDWVTVRTSPVRTAGPDFVLLDTQDITSKWLEYVFFPGRYSIAAIETALAQFSTAADLKPSASERSKPLQERLTVLVPLQATVSARDGITIDDESLVIQIDQQWRQFWRTLESINEGRYAPLTLACDPITNMVWLAMADLCCAIRECNNLELLLTNTPESLEDFSRISRIHWRYRETHKPVFIAKDAKIPIRLLSAAQNFLSSFPPELTVDFWQTLQQDLYTSSDIDTSTRIVNFFNLIDFANAVPDNVEKELSKDLAPIGGLEAIEDSNYNSLIQYVYEHHRRSGKPSNIKTEFGIQLISSALLDQMNVIRHVLLSLISLTIFVDESDQFHTAHFFEELVSKLKSLERTLWLATHFRRSSATGEDATSVSILQDIHGQALRFPSSDANPLPFVLMQHLRDNLDFIPGDYEVGPENAAVFFQCNLLKHEELQLASEFLKFQPNTKWSTYVKGRLYLATGEFHEAALCFRDASSALATGKALGKLEELSAGLLSEEEASCFNSGLPKYFDHILSLFEGQEAFTQAADFAHLLLTSLSTQKGDSNSHLQQKVLLRLFSAQLQCLKFDDAFEALVQVSDAAEQRACTIELVDSIMNTNRSLSDTAGTVKKIRELPLDRYPNITLQIDDHLASLAKKQSSIPSTTGLWLSGSSQDYLNILQALRLSRKDYRGAVAVLFDRLRIVQKSGRARSDPQATSLRHALLALINAMTCVPSDEAYVIADSTNSPKIGGLGLKRARDQVSSGRDSKRKRLRVVITLEDLRKEYQNVLDHCSRIERGDFELGGDDDEDDYESEEEQITNGNLSKLHIDRTGSQSQGTLQLLNNDAMQLT